MYERLTVTDVARILRAASDRADDDLKERENIATNEERAIGALLGWLADGAEHVDDENQKAVETPEARNA